MFPAGAVEAAEPMSMMAGSSCSSVAPAGTDQLDLEAAEQLIQLSGGDGAAASASADGDDDAGSSESRSADSFKCRSGKEKEAAAVAVAVESPRRSAAAGRIIIPVPAAGKGSNNGGAGEPDVKSVESFAACSTRAADDVVETKDKVGVAAAESCRRSDNQQRSPAAAKDRDGGGVVHGEKRKRPRFRSLASIYRDTDTDTEEPMRRLTAAGGEGHAGRDPPEDERKKERKRATDRGDRRGRRCRGEQGETNGAVNY